MINVIDETLKLLVYPTENDKIKWENTGNKIYETEYQGKKFKIWKSWPVRAFYVDDLRMNDFDDSLHKNLFQAVKQNEKRTCAQVAKDKVIEKEKELREETLPKLQALQKQETLNKSKEKDT